ncbi:MAG: glycosyltransferase [Granulosicoccus sp.]
MTSAHALENTRVIDLIQFWDNAVPEAVAELLASVETTNPELHYHCFSDISAAEYIEKEFGSETRTLYDVCAIPAMRADLFRYCFLVKSGGFYIDADYRAKQSVWPLVSAGYTGCLFERDRGLANGLLYFRDSEDPLAIAILESALHNIRTRSSNNVWGVTGPAVLKRLYANPAKAPLFEGFHLVNELEFGQYFETVACLDYKLDDRHWFVARHKGLNIFRD